MIRRLKLKDVIGFYNFILTTKDIYEDFYCTKNKQRIFFTDLKLITKLLKSQEVYAIKDKEIEGIMIILHEKGFRTYLKILAQNSKTEWDLLRFFAWNYFDEIYAKLKVNNPLVRSLQKHGFTTKGFRGKEILLFRSKQEKRKLIIGA